MRITIDIPDKLHSELKREAARGGSTMREIIIRALKSDLRNNEKDALKRRLPLIPSKTPGTLRLDNNKFTTLSNFPESDDLMP
jgi:hypothetical protein